ncbi:S-adenosyl-L-methionine-dependent methyltransferase [Geopyxis carbonaria]|nr:S-adenosyl-L-methionine-dependent methyltransferase [Geopyxis carbonaria]
MAPKGVSEKEESFEYIETPKAPESSCLPSSDACGVRTSSSPAIYNAPLPADGAGSDTFSNLIMAGAAIVVPFYLARKVGGGLKTFLFFALFTTIPILMAYWTLASSFSPRRTDRVKLPGKPIETYLEFKKNEDVVKYKGKTKIPMETFYEMYFDGDVTCKGDMLDVLEQRHDWANFDFTIGLFRHVLLGLFPEMLIHSKGQDEEQVRDHYDRGDDFYAWFLGPRMIYTSGIISDITKEETLEELQDNKLKIVCSKINLQPGDRMLDLGCGWGTLARFASKNFGAHVTGITLGRNQTAWGNSGLRRDGIPESQSRIVCTDYRDTPVPSGKYNKITCLEMAEHVGVRHFGSFLRQVHDMLEDDGVFFLQIAGLRKYWQYEDLIWGIFMNKHVFPGADASTPLGFFINALEGAGFEVKHVDTIGVHYSATLWRWYRNWLGNKDKVVAKYGERWFRIWEFFLAYSTIASRQGSATCYQITLHKNTNAFHRVEGIPTQYNLEGALKAPIPAPLD